MSSLVEAARRGDLKTVKAHVERGANLRAMYESKFSPLIKAAYEGHLEVVQYLVENGADVNTMNVYRDTPLMEASLAGRLEVVHYLVEKGADVNTMNVYRDSPLMEASLAGRLEVVQYLVENGADVNARDRCEFSPLRKAAYEGHLEVVQYLVENGADVNAKDSSDCTPLLKAADRGRLEMVQYLVENGAHVNANDHNGCTPLLVAVLERHVEVVQYLVENGADMYSKENSRGHTPLTIAVCSGQLQLVRCLVEHSANVNIKNEDGDTLLIEAARRQYLAVVRYLVENGADVSIANANGLTALDVSDSLAVVQFLTNQSDNNMQRDWLIPEEQIVLDDFEQRVPYQLHVVEWLGAKVVIKRVESRKQSDTLQQLSKEAKVWHRLYHPHIVLMFGACYMKNKPYIVCEYAPNGQLIEFLKAHPNELWRTLHEAALGLSFLHRMRVVHGDLKCNNILIGSDGFAKLTNFALSSLEALDETNEGGKLSSFGAGFRKREPTYELDLYSFGWCIIEAACGRISKRRIVFSHIGFDVLPHHRPQQFTDAQWNLVQRLCGSKKNHDLSALDLVQELRIFADEEKGDETNDDTVDIAWIDHMLEELEEYFSDDTNSADRMNRQVYERLTDVYSQLKPQSTFLSSYSSLAELFWSHMRSRSSWSNSSSLSVKVVNYAMSRQVANDASFFHHKIDRFMTGASLSMSAELHNWRSDWDLVRKEQNHKFMYNTQDEKTLLENIPEEEQEEVLTRLRYQLSKNYTNYETSVPDNMTRARTVVSTLCKNKGILYDSWFIPESDVAFDEHDEFASGGFGSVHYGKWLDARVAIKTVDLNAVHNTQDMFLKEVKVWHKLYHPHIVQMYGACHVGKPFIVCAFAPNGQLDNYLRNHPTDVWGKLYQAALGLLYLHHMRVIHGDLKCNNILIGADGFAKLTDFGLSSIEALYEPESTDEKDGKRGIGAVRWKAPEILKGENPTFQSDLYSFGMCIIEAVTGNYPWGNLDDFAVAYHVKDGKIPKRQEMFTDEQWELVEDLCSYEPSIRLSIVDAVGQLRTLAG